MAPTSYPPLPDISLKGAKTLEKPSLKIRLEEDVATWSSTKGYQNYLLFLHRLSESVVGHSLYDYSENRSVLSAAVRSILDLLDKLDSWIDEIPPLPTPQRFGNLAFRTWGKKLEDNAMGLLNSMLPEDMHGCIKLLMPYLVISFGSFTRMDYGTGHEAAFGLLLLCLTLIGFFISSPEEESTLVLAVFHRYLQLCWRLQDVYHLEPAGSHGVWGLDDYHFLGYIFGSAQLRDQDEVPVSAILRPPLSPTNLYFLQISRIHAVKHGPFFEHSSQLYAIATGVPNWGKVHSGLFKMYEAEVLRKRVVVQHIPVGGLLEWDTSEVTDASASAEKHGNFTHDTTTSPWARTSASSNLPPTLTCSPWPSAASDSSTRPSELSSSEMTTTRAPWLAGSSGTTQVGWEPLITRPSMATRVQVPPNHDHNKNPANSSNRSIH